MAGFQTVPLTMKGTMLFQVGGQKCQCSVYYKKTAPPTQADCQALANALLNTWWTTSLKPLVTPDFFLIGFTVTALDSPTAPIATATPLAGNTNGTGAGASIPSGSALVGTFKTQERSKNGHGRIYLAGIPAGQMADPIEVTANYLANWITALQALLTIATSVTATLVVVSRVIAGLQRPQGVTIPITSVAGDRLVDSQRRRLGGRGT